MNVIKRIRKANKERDPERLIMKYRAMRESSFAFFRGTCPLFYDRLAEYDNAKSGPLAWCCGDLHLENFGSYKGDSRLTYFDINDFDEATLAPATWELVRFVSSVYVGMRELEIPEDRTYRFATRFLQGYVFALAEGKARWVERETASGVVKHLLDQLRDRKRIDFLNGRTRVKGKLRRFLADGNKTLPVTDDERAMVIEFMQRFASDQENPGFYQVIDVARRIAGTGSLGVARYAILIEGKGSPDQNYLLDLKQAGRSSLRGHFDAIQPCWSSEAQRIVTLQRRIQAVPMAFLHPVTMGTKSYVLRALQPTEDRLPFNRFHHHSDLFDGAMDVMGKCVAWSHLRSSGRQGAAIADELIAFAQKKKWPAALNRWASELAGQAIADWKEYCKAYDEGVFRNTD